MPVSARYSTAQIFLQLIPALSAKGLGDLDRIRAETVEIGTRVLRVMRATGEQGYWAGDDEA